MVQVPFSVYWINFGFVGALLIGAWRIGNSIIVAVEKMAEVETRIAVLTVRVELLERQQNVGFQRVERAMVGGNDGA